MTPDLFSDIENDLEKNRKHKIGQTNIQYIKSASILTKAKGFMEAYDYTLNPYSGCSFGCNYCYAAFFARSSGERENSTVELRLTTTHISPLQLLPLFSSLGFS